MTDYLKLAGEATPPAAPSSGNPYLQLVQEDEKQRLARAGTVVETALRGDPEAAAEHQRLSATSGLPLRVVERNLDEVRIKERARALDLARMASESPILARQLTDPSFTNIAVDDVSTLGAIEKAVGASARYVMGASPGGGLVGRLQTFVPRAVGAWAGVKQAAMDVFDPWARLAAGDDNWFSRMSAYYAGQAAAADAELAALSARNDSVIGRGVDAGVDSLLQQAKYLPLALAGPGGAAAALGGMSAETFGSSYNKAAQKGLPLWQSLGYASSDAMVEFWTEKLPLDALVGDISTAAPIAKVLLRQIAREVPGEQAATILQDLNEWATLNPGKPFVEYLAERPEAAAETFIATIVGVGGNVALTHQLSRTADAVMGTDWRGYAAQSYAEQLQEAMRAASASTLRERSPETFQQFATQVAESQGAEARAVYVDAEVLAQMPATVLSRLSPELQRQVQEEAEVGGVVALPIADALTFAPGTPLEQALIEHGRVAPDAPSMAESKAQGAQAQAWLDAQLEEVQRQAQDKGALEVSREVIQGRVAQQIAASGRFSPAVADAYGALTATFFTVQAERLRRAGGKWADLTPEQLYDRWNLRVNGTAGKGLVYNDTGPQASETGRLDNVEAYHFSMQDRPTISTQAYGSNYAGSGRELYANAADVRLRNRAYFYVDKGTGINPEAGVGGRGHRAYLNNIYDADRDPLNLKKGADQLAFESAVLDAGFSGYLSRLEGTQSGQVIALGPQAIRAELLGPTSRIASGQRVPALPAVAPQWQVQASGTPEQLRLRLARMQSSPAWAAYDIRIEGSNLEVRPKTADTFAQRAAGDTRFQPLARERLAAIRPPRRSAVGLMLGGEKPPVFRTIFEISRWFTERNRRGAEDMSDAAVRRRMLDALYADTLAALTDAGSAVGWYDAKVKAALDIVAQLHPEIATSEEARFGFIAVLAITSNQTLVAENFELANAIYSKWKETGELPVNVGEVMDTRAKTEMSKSLAKLRDLIAEHGWQRMREFMVSKLPAGEIESFTGYPVTGESKGSVVYGAVFLGPKIGAFFNNLYGNFDTVTMDRWFMRTINRIRGSMLALPESFGANLAALAAHFDDNPSVGLQFDVSREQAVADLAAYQALDTEARGDVLQVLAALPNLGRYAKERHKLFAKGRMVGGKMRSYVDRTPENQLAKNIDLALHGDQQTPRGGGDRELMRELVFKLQQKLKADGIDMVVADIQAALWYYEKDLVARLKGEDAQADMFGEAQEAEDYETAARRLLAAGRDDPAGGSAGRAGRAQPRSGGARSQAPAGPTTGDLFAQRDGGGVDGNGEGGDTLGSLAPLPGAPDIKGASGPDPRLVAVAEQYARDKGITLRRQAEYVEVDPERAARIAAAYDAMPHAPQDPRVAQAYAELIEQTVAQYRALEAAGYRFYFFDETSDPYAGNPWNAMRDLRANQTMGVFATEAGFGSGATELDVSNNPLLADTGITWPGPDGAPKRVLANDLFRAVHDAFGHGLEGAGFRAQGEENAWQAHTRLFTGLAVGAITTETRGQNSWLNYGPYGEQNRKAKVEDTVFADQKTGLMPEWTWTEGRADDAAEALEQDTLGTFSPSRMEIVLNKGANLSTFVHELGHAFLEFQADLASDPDAPDDIKQDMARVLAWFGVESLDAWRALPFAAKVPYHEKFAESFERYILEGRAPSQALQPFFRKFRAWMLSTYKSLKQFLERRPDAGELSEDIRKVFDRMLAAQDQIEQTEEALALPVDPEATAAAEERLAARSLRDLKWSVKARDKFIRRLQLEAKAVRERIRNEVAAEVNELPVVKAKLHLDALSKTPDRDAAVAIRRAAREEVEPLVRRQVIADMIGDQEIKGLAKGQWIARNRREIDLEIGKRMLEWDKANPAPAPLQNVTDGDLAIVADSFNYTTPDEMLAAIREFGDKEEVIDALTERRMLEEHGDLNDERAIEEAASQAVHNEARARSLASELRTQDELLGARKPTGEKTANGAMRTVSMLFEAAKQFGDRIAGGTLVRDLKDATWRHTAAEQRAGRRWYAATKEGKTADAAKAKQDQVLNNGAVRALQQARADVLEAREFFKRVLKGNDEKVVEKGRDPDLVNAARAVLRAYGFETPTTRAATAYLETLVQRDPATSAVVQGYIDAANAAAQPADALTVDQLRELHETIKAIWNLAKETRSMEVKGDKLDIDDAADELSDKLDQHPTPVVLPGSSQALTKADQRKSWLQYAGALLRRVEAWAELLDGAHGGPFQRLVFQPIKDAADRYRADRVAYRRELVKLLEHVAPTFSGKTIEAPEIGYTFGKGHNGVGHAELLHALLHTGNPSNKRKLLLGGRPNNPWATLNDDGTLDTSKWDAMIQRLADQGVLTPAHYDFVQGVWDLMERTKPLAQETHRKVFGRYFSEVASESFADPWGRAMRGGYAPAQADPRLVQDAALRTLADAENKSMAFAFPATNRGFTQSRVDYNRPLVLDLRTLSQHLDKVLLFSHMEAPVRAARRLLTHKRVSTPLAKLQPAAYSGMLLPWLNRSAQQIVEDPVVGDGGISRILPLLRARAGMALMMANVSNTLQQLTGFSSALVKVGPGNLMRATAQYIASPGAFKAAVHGASKAMAERMGNEVSAMSGIMDDILVSPSRYESMQRWAMQHSHFLQAAVDNVMSPIVWTAAYNQELAKGRSEEDARDFADATVRQTQGSSLPEDVSRFETGPAFVRVFTQFMGYFNMVANTNVTAVRQVIDRLGVKQGALPASYLVLMGLLVPIWVAEAIAQGMRGGPEDDDDDGYLDDWLMAVFGFGTLKGTLAAVPGAAQAGQLVLNRFNDNPADDRMSLSPAISLIESATAAPFSVAKAIETGKGQQKAVRDVAALVTVATGLPAYPLARPLGYAAGVAGGSIDPAGPADAVRGTISGTASPESKD